jgi:polyphosphate kinase
VRSRGRRFESHHRPDISRLHPGVDGVSDTVTVRSLVGRFLEHPRVFYFRAGGAERFYLGSADWMTRNLDNRVEAVTPVEDPDLQARLRAVLRLTLQDTRRAWELAADGTTPGTGRATTRSSTPTRG